MQENRKKTGLITRHLRHFAFRKVFFSSEGDSETSAASKTELFCDISQRLKVISLRHLEVHPRYVHLRCVVCAL